MRWLPNITVSAFYDGTLSTNRCLAHESGTSELDSADDPRWSSRVFETTAIWWQHGDLVREQIFVVGRQWNLHVCSNPRLDGMGSPLRSVAVS